MIAQEVSTQLSLHTLHTPQCSNTHTAHTHASGFMTHTHSGFLTYCLHSSTSCVRIHPYSIQYCILKQNGETAHEQAVSSNHHHHDSGTGATPTMAPHAYHPYQMPMVQNSYTKAVENSDMLPSHFNAQLEKCDEWMEELQQWLGGCDPTYGKANEARMILSTLFPWLKGISNT